jgi:hypothetical protein
LFSVENRTILPDLTVTKANIIKKIENLKKDSAAGPDNIHLIILKELKNQLALPLKLIFEKSLATGIVPKDGKRAKVIPIYNKGQKSEPGNYRPVSLKSVPCKILDSILKDEIMEHLSREKINK